MTAKTRAKPSLHLDSLSAPLTRGTRMLPGAVVGLRLLKHTAGPLAKIIRTMNQSDKLSAKVLCQLLTGLIILLIPLTSKAQLFEDVELFPQTSIIKGKYYSGSGGGGYWSLDYVDSIGRVVVKESYHKKELMSRRKIEYDNHNNKVFDIQTFDFNNSERIDTFRYEYKYDNNRIVYQYRKLSSNDSTVIELVENIGDSVLIYQEKAFYFRPKTGKTDVFEKIYTLKYRNKLLTSNEIYSKEKNSKEIKTYDYYDNGRLKRRIIERIPKPEQKSFYVGGPGSDNEYYKYTFDSNGRIKKFYRIIEGKKFKIAVYKYV